MSAATVKTTDAELAAELRILEAYDSIRRTLGHDYGVGQRYAELRRVRREAAVRGVEDHVSTTDELAAAFKRIGRPRRQRIEYSEAYRRNTPAGNRAMSAWAMLELALDMAAQGVKTLDEAVAIARRSGRQYREARS